MQTMKTPTTDSTMTPAQFKAALDALHWSQADFCRKAGLSRPTPSRWANGLTPIPMWAAEYLGLLQELQRLHATYLTPPKPDRVTD